jgi:hypothetical protein
MSCDTAPYPIASQPKRSRILSTDVGASRGMAGSVAVDRQLPQRVVGGCGAEFVREVLVDGCHQALAAAGCSFSARLVLLTCVADNARSTRTSVNALRPPAYLLPFTRPSPNNKKGPRTWSLGTRLSRLNVFIST